MSRTLTQQAVQALKRQLATVPTGAVLDVRALLEATGIPAHASLVARRLREAGWIAPDGHGGWLRSAPKSHERRRPAG